MNTQKYTYIFLLIFVSTFSTKAQKKVNIYGNVTDKATGERLIGVNLISKSSKQGTNTNTLGNYTLQIKTASDTVFVSYTGYKTLTVPVKTQTDENINFQLVSAGDLEEVMVESQRMNHEKIGTVKLSMKTLQALPMLGGEADPMKGLQLLPGVKSGSEGNAGIYVRGGTPDQNLILLDGVPVYNASHLFGFTSTFNPSVIQNLELTKGGFPARYGGRLASVIDITTREGNMNTYKNEIKLGIISSHIQSEGPIKKDKASFLISARRSLYELYSLPAQWAGANEEKTNYYLGDMNVKINHKLSKKDRLSLSIYVSKDQLGEKDTYSYDREEGTNSNGFNWGNEIGSLRWERTWSSKLFSNLIFYKNNYQFKTFNNAKGISRGLNGEKDTVSLSNVGYQTKIDDLGASWAFDYNLNNNHRIKFGANAVSHLFAPGVNRSLSVTYSDKKAPLPTVTKVNDIKAKEARFYIEDSWKLKKIFQLNYGVHASLFDVRNVKYTSFEPRLAAMVIPSSDFNFKVSYTKMKQYLHLLTNSGLGLPTDLWIPPTDKLAPQQSEQVSAGIFYHLDNLFDITLEAYYKNMNGLVDYKEGASFLIQGNDWETKVASKGKGTSKGIELLIEKKTSRFTSWLSYTLAKTERQFSSINKGLPYPFKYDRTHEINLVGVYKISDKWEFSSAFNFSTGNAITLPKAVYATTTYPVSNFNGGVTKEELIWISWDQEPKNFPPISAFAYGGKNSSRLPNYHRLDVGFNRHKEKERGSATLNLSVYNIYAKANPYYVRYKTVGSGATASGYFEMVSFFQFVPAVSWYRKF